MKNYTTSMGYNANRKSLLAVLLMLLATGGCKKPEISKGEPAPKLLSAHASIAINIEDMVAKIPKTLLYNMGDSLHLYLDRAQWRWESSCLKVRIPMSLNSNSFLCGIKYYDKPDETLVYISQFIHDPGSTNLNFSGMQVWIDLQDWNVYGLQYKHDSVVAYSDPIQLADAGWEECALESGAFGFNDKGKIIIKGNGGDAGRAQTMGGNKHPEYGCYGEGNFWDDLGGFFGDIGGWFGDMGTGLGKWVNDNLFPALKALLHPGIGGGSDGNPDGNGPGGNYGPGGDYPGGGSFPGGGIGDGGGSGGTGGGYYNPGGGTNDPNDTANTDPPIHGGGAAISWPGGTQINPVPTPFPVFEQPDSNGFYPSRIAAADVYFQDHPNGGIDCSDLVGFFGDMWQRWQNVANYQVPETVEQRISDIINQYFLRYNEDNFKIQKIGDANGPTINCDFFALHINTLPQNTSGAIMTAEEFLDYLRENLNDFDNLGNNTPGFYGIYNDAPNDGLNDASKFFAGYETSLGGLAHFNNNVPYTLGTVYNDGTVIESGYNQDANDLYWMYTTMKSPLDGQHPVSGNRKFGIFPDATNGGYELYIMGVDRTTDNFTTFMNNYFKVVFSNADAWWISIITGAKNYINSHNGNAEFYTDPNGGFVNRRVLWEGPMGQFLRKEITLQQLMNLYNCP